MGLGSTTPAVYAAQHQGPSRLLFPGLVFRVQGLGYMAEWLRVYRHRSLIVYRCIARSSGS